MMEWLLSTLFIMLTLLCLFFMLFLFAKVLIGLIAYIRREDEFPFLEVWFLMVMVLLVFTLIVTGVKFAL